MRIRNTLKNALRIHLAPAWCRLFRGLQAAEPEEAGLGIIATRLELSGRGEVVPSKKYVCYAELRRIFFALYSNLTYRRRFFAIGRDGKVKNYKSRCFN